MRMHMAINRLVTVKYLLVLLGLFVFGVVGSAQAQSYPFRNIFTGGYANQSELLFKHPTERRLVLRTLFNGAVKKSFELPNIPKGWNIIGTGAITGTYASDIIWREQATGKIGIWALMNVITTGDPPDYEIILSSVDVYYNGLTFDLDPSWVVVGFGDYNGDKITDLLIKKNNAEVYRQVLIWFDSNYKIQTLNRSFPRSLNLKTGETIIGTGDFNRDGISDLFVRNTKADKGHVRQIRLNSDGSIHSKTDEYKVGMEWSVFEIDDFNDDGIADILWRNNNMTTVRWINEMTGNNPGGQVISAQKNADWQIETTGRFNNDEFSDIVWRNRFNGNLEIWMMTRDGTVASQVSQGPTALDWEIVRPNVFGK